MDDIAFKNQMINAMLAQQDESAENQGTLKTVELPDKETLEKFKEIVNMYIQTDDLRKKLQEAIREQNVKARKLSQSILMFMSKYDIDDLKASDGVRLRYKKTMSKEPLSAKVIRERLESKFEELRDKPMDEIQNEIFGRKEVERVTLRRLKRNTLNV